MATNLVEALADLYAKDPKRANWLGVPSLVGTNDFGFVKVRHVEKIIPGTSYDFNFRCAFSSNPTISPVLSRAKVTVAGIWIPLSLYVPALRDGASVEALKTDYAFPTINFPYLSGNLDWNSASNSASRDARYRYIPANSLFTELNMWEPYYTPISRYVPNPTEGDSTNPPTAYPKGKCAIPLLGYYDFFRHFILNNQQSLHPIRIKGFSRRYDNMNNPYTQDPIDNLISRSHLDKFFNNIRKIGNGGTFLNLQSDVSYPMGDDAFDISLPLANLYFGAISSDDTDWAPVRQLAHINNFDGTSDYVWYNDDHFGEVRATLMSDFNTAYMSNENVEYERTSARVKVDDEGYLDMEQIYAGQRIQNFMRRSIFRENDYASFINAETGITPPTNLTKPLFLGSVSSWINYNDVISQAQTDTDDTVESNTSLGSRASLGFGRMVTGSMGGNNRSFARFTAKEPGYFMLLEWIVPEVSYWQGYHPMYDKTTLMSIYYPSFDRSGFQDQQLVHLAEMVHDSVDNDHPYAGKYPFKPMDIDTYNVSLMQVPAYWEHMVYRNRLTGQMVDQSTYLPWNFAKQYKLSDFIFSQGIEDTGTIRNSYWTDSARLDYHVTNTYVDPESFHNIYANTEGLDNIQCYYKFKIKKYQPLSHRFLSF